MPTIAHILYSQIFTTPPSPSQDFSYQTCIITGANTGLGLEAARHLVRLNVKRLILAVRSHSRGETAKKSIEESEKRRGVVEVWLLDLASYESVRAFAKRVNDEVDRIDCVIENAGINAHGPRKMAEGNELTITVNVVSTFLLAILLLPALRRTASTFNTQPRLVIVASEAHGLTSFPERKSNNIFETLNADESSAGLGRRYFVSKLLDVLLTRELAKNIGNSDSRVNDVVVNCVNPGFCRTGLGREAGPILGKLLYFVKLILARTSEVGSRTLVWSAAGSSDTHGQYMSDCQVEA
jgi:retinol dehydrogenase-12